MCSWVYFIGSFTRTGVSVDTILSFATFCTTIIYPSTTKPITSGCIGVDAVAIIIAIAFLVCALVFPVQFSKFSNFCGQLHTAIVLLMQCTLIVWVALHILPCEAFFGVPFKLYFLQSPGLRVFCGPPCFLHSAQCFASLPDFLGIWSLNDTILLLEEPPPVTIDLGPSHSFSVG